MQQRAARHLQLVNALRYALERDQMQVVYQPQVSLSEGLQRLLRWYLDQHKTPEELLEQEILHNWVPASDPV